MFADRVKELRTTNGLSQRAFAERIGVSPTTVVSYEKGGKTPAYDILVKIAGEFGISLDWLCEITADTAKRDLTAADCVRMIVQLIDTYPDADMKADIRRIDISLPEVNSKLNTFMVEYNRMKELIKNGTIYQDLFDLWYQTKLSDLEKITIEDLPF